MPNPVEPSSKQRPGRKALAAEANRAIASGDFLRAIPLLRELQRQQPNDLGVMYALGSSLASIRELAEAERWLKKVLRKSPRHVGALSDLATVYRDQDRWSDALRTVEKALSLEPDHPGAQAAKANLLLLEGRAQDAADVLAPAVAKGVDDPTILLAWSLACERLKRFDEAEPQLRRILGRGDLKDATRADLLFALSRLLNASGRYDDAFDAASEANRLRPRRFDPGAFNAAIDLMIRNWDAETIRQIPASSIASQQPVFIVGMPRSGTSLVEQILASHPQVHGAGELPHIRQVVHELTGGFSTSGVLVLTDPTILDRQTLDKSARAYLRQIAQGAGRGGAGFHPAARITDKMPTNFLHLGLIDRMLPGARVIHTTRHPLDTCISCFFQSFGGNIPFAYDLEHLGAFHRGYERLMSHWRKVLAVPILDVSYEELVSDLERWSRAMIDFLGIDWDDACLRFYETDRVTHTSSFDQVRRPVYRDSVHRFRRYERHLAPLKKALGWQEGQVGPGDAV